MISHNLPNDIASRFASFLKKYDAEAIRKETEVDAFDRCLTYLAQGETTCNCFSEDEILASALLATGMITKPLGALEGYLETECEISPLCFSRNLGVVVERKKLGLVVFGASLALKNYFELQLITQTRLAKMALS